MAKRIVAAILVLALAFSLCACGSSLKGTYVSENGWYEVKFESNGKCTWYQDGLFFNGTYYKTKGGWQLDIVGNGSYRNTIFIAEQSGKNLTISGGMVYEEVFHKK